MPDITRWNINDDNSISNLSFSDSFKMELSFNYTSNNDNKEFSLSSENNNNIYNNREKNYKEFNIFEKVEEKNNEEYYENFYI